jgi:chromosome segregation ATPase
MDAELKQYLDANFATIRAELSAINTRFDAVDAKFAGIDAKFAAIDVKFAAIDAKFAAIDAELAGIKAQIKELEARIMERMDGRIDAVEERMKDYVKETVRDMETTVISEFHKWGRTSDMRTRQAITDTGFLGDRLLAIEDRVSALERGRTT